MSDILDTIDGAIHDWETSGDAMRWLPERARTPDGWRQGAQQWPVAGWHEEGESLPVQVVGPFRLTGTDYDHANGMVTYRVEFDARLFADGMRRVQAAMERLTEQFTGLTYSIDPPLYDGPVPRPETSRQRALRLMRERSHGPDVPLDRRPRRLP